MTKAKIEIELDTTRPIVSEFLEWTETHADRLTEVVILGYSFYKYGLDEYQKNLPNDETETETQPQTPILNLQEIISDIVQKTREDTKTELNDSYKQRLELELAAERARNEAAIVKAVSAAQKQTETCTQDLYRQMAKANAAYETLKKLHDETINGMHAQTITQKTRELEEAISKINILKNTNNGKCNMGELTVLEYLKNAFPHYTYERKGGGTEAHACDIHMIDENGRVLAIEIKNKATITRDDVVKFEGDILNISNQMIGKKLVGGVFVSLRSINIPTKGELRLEYKEEVPLLYMGINEDSEMCMLSKYVKMLWTMHREDGEDRSISEYIECCNNQMSRIENHRKQNKRMSKLISEMYRELEENEKSINEMSNELEKLLNKNVPIKITEAPQKKVGRKSKK